MPTFQSKDLHQVQPLMKHWWRYAVIETMKHWWRFLDQNVITIVYLIWLQRNCLMPAPIPCTVLFFHSFVLYYCLYMLTIVYPVGFLTALSLQFISNHSNHCLVKATFAMTHTCIHRNACTCVICASPINKWSLESLPIIVSRLNHVVSCMINRF